MTLERAGAVQRTMHTTDASGRSSSKPEKVTTSRLSERAQHARARAAEVRQAQAAEFAADWMSIMEDEMSGNICPRHALMLRISWQHRVQQLSAFQQKRCHQRTSQAGTDWLADPGLQRRLDQPWMDELARIARVCFRTFGIANNKLP